MANDIRAARLENLWDDGKAAGMSEPVRHARGTHMHTRMNTRARAYTCLHSLTYTRVLDAQLDFQTCRQSDRTFIYTRACMQRTRAQ